MPLDFATLAPIVGPTAMIALIFAVLWVRSVIGQNAAHVRDLKEAHAAHAADMRALVPVTERVIAAMEALRVATQGGFDRVENELRDDAPPPSRTRR